MALNLLYLLPADSQETFMSKTNFNFDLLNSSNGGPQGLQGIQGVQGVPGSQGLIGLTGATGTAGTKWYTRPGVPVGIITPAPAAGDDWLDTLNLDLYQYNGVSWILIGTLSVPGVFELSFPSATSIILNNPTLPVVVSTITYPSDPPLTGRGIKIIGPPSAPILQLGIAEFGNIESSAINLTSLYLERTIGYPGTTLLNGNVYNLHTDNNSSGNISFGLDGNSFGILTPIGAGSLGIPSIPTFQFDSVSLQLQLPRIPDVNGNFDKVLSFSTGSAGTVKYHVGKNDAYTNTPSRLFTVADDGTLGIGDVYNNKVFNEDPNNIAGNHGSYIPGSTNGVMLDIMAHTLEQGGTSSYLTSNRLLRLRGALGDFFGIGIFSTLEFVQNRLYADNINADSVEWRIQNKALSGIEHFISFHGGNDNLAPDAGASLPALRFGYSGTGVGDGYYFGANNRGLDKNYVGFGDNTFITSFNGGSVYDTRMNIEWSSGAGSEDPIEGIVQFGGQHMFFDPSLGVGNQYVGITAGYGTAIGLENNTNAGILFRTDSFPYVYPAYSQGTSLHLLTSVISPYQNHGQRKRLSISAEGMFDFWGSDNLDASAATQPVPKRNFSLNFNTADTTTVIDAKDPLFGTPHTSGVLVIGTVYYITTFVAGDDFSNVGSLNVTGDTFTATGTTPTTWTNSSKLFISSQNRNVVLLPNTDSSFYADYFPNLGQPFAHRAGGGLLGIGNMSFVPQPDGVLFVTYQPQTKFQVVGAVTIGTRPAVSNYAIDVSAGDEGTPTYSLTVGTLNYISGLSLNSFISGADNSIGKSNSGYGNRCAILGGFRNAINFDTQNSVNSVIIGGIQNAITSTTIGSVIIGGANSTIQASTNVIFLGVSDLLASDSDHVYSNNISVQAIGSTSSIVSMMNQATPTHHTFTVSAADGDSSIGIPGNHLYLSSGSALDNGSNYDGGNLSIISGNGDLTGGGSSHGGTILIQAGVGEGTGGPINIFGGAADTGSGNNGGIVTIRGGAGDGSGNGGNTFVYGGGSSSGTGGNISIISGGGDVSGSATIKSSNATTTGGNVNITAGNGAASGGNILLTPGTGSTPGELTINGKITINASIIGTPQVLTLDVADGWAVSTHAPTVRKDFMGNVSMFGQVRAPGGQNQPLILPSEYHPATNRIWPIWTSSSIITSYAIIQSNGTVQLFNIDGSDLVTSIIAALNITFNVND